MTKRKWTSRARTFAMAFAAVGALVWSGCGNDGASSGSYYCDSTGCYSCDGYSCRGVPPPTAAACTGSAGCPGGYVCTSAGCEKSCTESRDCSDGLVCTSGLCTPPGQPPGQPIGCTTNLDCPTGDTCVDRECVATDAGVPPVPPADGGVDAPIDSGPTCGGSLGPCACTSDKQCDPGQVCVAGACTAASNACKYDSECPAGDVCADGQCVPDCSTKTCPGGSTCVKGACEPNPVGGGCTSSAQCPVTAPVCAGGQCTTACTGDKQCPTGDYCNQGACVPDTRPTPNCTATGGQCLSTQQCVTGFCRYTCATNQQCQLIDARIPVCAADGVCRDATEGNPQCTSKDQCPSGQDCIGNVCK